MRRERRKTASEAGSVRLKLRRTNGNDGSSKKGEDSEEFHGVYERGV